MPVMIRPSKKYRKLAEKILNISDRDQGSKKKKIDNTSVEAVVKNEANEENERATVTYQVNR